MLQGPCILAPIDLFYLRLYPSHIVPLVNYKKENYNLNTFIFSFGPLSFGFMFKTLYFEVATCVPVGCVQITPDLSLL